MRQGGRPGVRGPTTAPQGGTIDVEVGTNDPFVEVSLGGEESTRYPVDPAKKASIPVPPVPPGTLVIISIGTGLRRKVLLVEVVEDD